MHRYLLHNDDIREADSRSLGAGQIGLLAGWGVFSTLRVYDGVLLAGERHWRRMQTDARRMRVPFPAEASWLEERLYRLIEANGAREATLRVVVVRNRGGMFEGPGNTREFDAVPFTREVHPWGSSVKLGLVPNARLASSEFAGTKYLSWAENLTWYERAHEQGWDEMVLLNERGEIAECTSANVFAVQGDRVWTPPLSAGCLPGVTRGLLLEEIRVPGLEILEKTLRPADLESADEVFITSTTRELLPVAWVEGLRLKGGRAVRDTLQEAFSKYRSSYISSYKSGHAQVLTPRATVL